MSVSNKTVKTFFKAGRLPFFCWMEIKFYYPFLFRYNFPTTIFEGKYTINSKFIFLPGCHSDLVDLSLARLNNKVHSEGLTYEEMVAETCELLHNGYYPGVRDRTTKQAFFEPYDVEHVGKKQPVATVTEDEEGGYSETPPNLGNVTFEADPEEFSQTVMTSMHDGLHYVFVQSGNESLAEASKEEPKQDSKQQDSPKPSKSPPNQQSPKPSGTPVSPSGSPTGSPTGSPSTFHKQSTPVKRHATNATTSSLSGTAPSPQVIQKSKSSCPSTDPLHSSAEKKINEGRKKKEEGKKSQHKNDDVQARDEGIPKDDSKEQRGLLSKDGTNKQDKYKEGSSSPDSDIPLSQKYQDKGKSKLTGSRKKAEETASGKVHTKSGAANGKASSKKVVASTSKNVVPSTSKKVDASTTKNVVPSTSKKVDASTSRKVVPSTSKKVDASSSKKVVPSTSKKIDASTSKKVVPSTSKKVDASTSKKVVESGSDESSGPEIISEIISSPIKPRETRAQQKLALAKNVSQENTKKAEEAEKKGKTVQVILHDVGASIGDEPVHFNRLDFGTCSKKI